LLCYTDPMKRNLGVLLVILAIAAIWLAYGPSRKAATSPAAEEPQPAAEMKKDRFEWELAWRGQKSDERAPTTHVTLIDTDNGRQYELGDYSGSCSTLEGSPWPLLLHEQTGIVCIWQAGSGAEVGVFDEDGELVVKAGTIQTNVGVTEEGAGPREEFRGNFKAVQAIE